MDARHLDAHRTQYREKLHTFLRKYTSPSLIARLKNAIKKAPHRQVCVNGSAERWKSAKLQPSDPVLNFYVSPEHLELIAACTALPLNSFQGIRAWAHSYSEGESIPRHRDAAGFCQLVVGLELLADADSSLLYIESGSGSVGYRLDPGDALLFKATQLYHWTRPLRKLPRSRFAKRTVLVVRYGVAS